MSKNTSVNLSEHLVESREAGLDRVRRAVAASEASGEALPFDMESWLEEQDRLDSAP
jgi:hypothetical protein